jgi:TonB family protein
MAVENSTFTKQHDSGDSKRSVAPKRSLVGHPNVTLFWTASRIGVFNTRDCFLQECISSETMMLSPNLEEIAQQSEPDIRDYRSIFDRHSVPFGSPKNFSNFIQRLRDDANFARDFWTLTDFIRSREKGYLTNDESFTLIVISAAGPDLSMWGDEINNLLRDCAVLLARRNESFSTEGNYGQSRLAPLDLPFTRDATIQEYAPLGDTSFSVPVAHMCAQQPNQRRNFAIVGFLLFITVASVGSVVVQNNRSGKTRYLEPISAQQKIANKLEPALASIPVSGTDSTKPSAPTVVDQTTPSRPDTVGDQSANHGSRRTRAIGNDSVPAFSPDVAANAHPIRPIRHNANFAITSPSAFTSYPMGTSRRIDLSSGVMADNLMEWHPPAYPRLASLARVQGSVFLQAIVSGRGTVESVHVIKGPHLLRRAAEDTVRTWRYKPYFLNGKPVDVATIVTIDFALKR